MTLEGVKEAADEHEDEAPEVDEGQEGQEIDQVGAGSDGASDVDAEEEGDEDEGVTEVVFESDDADQPGDDTPAPKWVKELRKKYREAARKAAQLEREIASLRPAPTLPEKPRLEQFGYDEDAFEAALDKWHEAKREYEAAQAKAKEAERRKQEEWQARAASYAEAKARFKSEDYEVAEKMVEDMLTLDQQAALVTALGGDAASLVMALGRRPEKLAELSEITDPIRFAAQAAKMHSALKVIKRPRTKPERLVRGKPAASSSTEDRLLESSDLTEYLRARKKKRQRA